MEGIDKNEVINQYLKSLYGISEHKAEKVLTKIGISKKTKYGELRGKKKARLSEILNEIKRVKEPVETKEGYKQEPIEYYRQKWEKKRIDELIELDTYRGRRHKEKLPVRGQRTRSNAKTARKSLRRHSQKTKKA